MELWWKIAAITQIILETSVMGYFLYRFTKPFLKQKKYAWGIGAIYVLAMIILYFVPVQINNFLAYSIGIWLAFGVMCVTDRRNYRQKIFITVTFYSIRWLSAYLTQTFSDVISRDMIRAKYISGHENVQLAFFIGANLLQLACVAIIVGVSSYFMVNAYVSKDEDMSVRELLMLITPSVVAMTEYAILQYYNNYYQGNTTRGYSILAMAHYGISIIMIVVVISLSENLKERQEEKLQRELLSSQIEDTKRHMEQVERLYDDIRSLKHDMANHITTLEQLYGTGKIRQAEAYTDSLKHALYDATGQVRSGNPITDVILAEYQKKAEERGITFESSFFYPGNETLDVFCVSVILNNALENALQAAEEYKENHEKSYIKIRSYQKNNAYMMEVENNFNGSLEINPDTGFPDTKKQTKGHGYGLSNIKKAAEKYHGGVDVQIEKNRFQLVVMLMLV